MGNKNFYLSMSVLSADVKFTCATFVDKQILLRNQSCRAKRGSGCIPTMLKSLPTDERELKTFWKISQEWAGCSERCTCSCNKWSIWRPYQRPCQLQDREQWALECLSRRVMSLRRRFLQSRWGRMQLSTDRFGHTRCCFYYFIR